MFGSVAGRAALAAALIHSAAALALGANVDFESLPAGTGFGAGSGESPGQVVFSQSGIPVSVESFHTNSSTGFFRAQVNAPGTDLFSTKHMFLDNISLGFDLSALGFAVNQVTIDYHEFGGADNFSVNGGPILDLPAMVNIPVNVAPGVTALTDSDSITLSGSVSRFLIGGQELAVDNIVAVPEPTCLALLAVGGLSLVRKVRRSSSTRRD